MSDEELSLEQIEKIIKAIKDNPELQDSTFILLQALFGHIVNLEMNMSQNIKQFQFLIKSIIPPMIILNTQNSMKI